MNRRSFFTSLAKAAAIVALAPQLAFRAKAIKIELPEIPKTCEVYWMQTYRYSACVDAAYEEWFNNRVARRK